MDIFTPYKNRLFLITLLGLLSWGFLFRIQIHTTMLLKEIL